MARMMECDECQHVQMVGIIPNGLPAGFPDPHKECENPECSSVGLYSTPGSNKRMQEQIENMLRAAPDLGLLGVDRRLDKLSRQIEANTT